METLSTLQKNDEIFIVCRDTHFEIAEHNENERKWHYAQKQFAYALIVLLLTKKNYFEPKKHIGLSFVFVFFLVNGYEGLVRARWIKHFWWSDFQFFLKIVSSFISYHNDFPSPSKTSWRQVLKNKPKMQFLGTFWKKKQLRLVIFPHLRLHNSETFVHIFRLL